MIAIITKTGDGSENPDDDKYTYEQYTLSDATQTWGYFKGSESDMQSLVDNGEVVYIESRDEAMSYMGLIKERIFAYPEISEQLDQIFHEGLDAWKETIQAVKDANPKPE